MFYLQIYLQKSFVDILYFINFLFTNTIKLINHVIQINDVFIRLFREILNLIFQFNDFIKIVYFYLYLLKFSTKKIIHYIIIYIFRF